MRRLHNSAPTRSNVSSLAAKSRAQLAALDMLEQAAQQSLHAAPAELNPIEKRILSYHVAIIAELGSRITPNCTPSPTQVLQCVSNQREVTERILSKLSMESTLEGAIRIATVVALQEATFLYETQDRQTMDALIKDRSVLTAQLAETNAALEAMRLEMATIQKTQVSMQTAANRKLSDERSRVVAAQLENQRQAAELRRLSDYCNVLKAENARLLSQNDDNRWWTRAGEQQVSATVSAPATNSSDDAPKPRQHPSVGIRPGTAATAASHRRVVPPVGAMRPGNLSSLASPRQGDSPEQVHSEEMSLDSFPLRNPVGSKQQAPRRVSPSQVPPQEPKALVIRTGWDAGDSSDHDETPSPNSPPR